MKNEKKDHTGLFILCIVIISIVLVIVGPMWIDEAFQEKATNEYFEVHWNDEHALNYYGAALTFLGTVAFSALALWQNHVFKEANEKHEKILLRMEKMKNMPIFSCDCSKKNNTGEYLITVVNETESTAFDVNLSEVTVLRDGDFEKPEDDYDLGIIKFSEKRYVDIELKKKVEFNETMTIKISFKDRYNETHFYKFVSFRYANIPEKIYFKALDLDEIE
ncbi:MAG: hypothetical protein E7482_03315 [Ruminococcaceae bacterium]|nr:hypothetical protein [Oscillospiraceae bacterium]